MRLQVVAAALVDTNRNILMQQRPPDKAHAGLWEFPGGKIEPGESAGAALVRELAEELGIEVALSALTPLTFAVEPLPDDRELRLLLFACRDWRGEPEAREASALRWVGYDDLLALPMPPADIALARQLGFMF
jgi:8-oxo-dGTP diphosphatase